MSDDIYQLARLGLTGEQADIKMYLARIIRKYRVSDSAFAGKLASLLQADYDNVQPSSRILRSSEERVVVKESITAPEKPLLPQKVEEAVKQILEERRSAKILRENGLGAVSAVIFTGPPGVGKTMTARWIAAELRMNMVRLDLATSMSSRFGATGNNLKSAFDEMNNQGSILFIDEIDAIAKTRRDNSDIGEMKRLVTVLLQEMDSRNLNGLVIASTNDPELIDPAVWRRFEMRIEFSNPDEQTVHEIIRRDLCVSKKCSIDSSFIEMLTILLNERSPSDIRNAIASIKKTSLLRQEPLSQSIVNFVANEASNIPYQGKKQLVRPLYEDAGLSQRAIAATIDISRPTVKKIIDSSKMVQGKRE